MKQSADGNSSKITETALRYQISQEPFLAIDELGGKCFIVFQQNCQAAKYFAVNVIRCGQVAN